MECCTLPSLPPDADKVVGRADSAGGAAVTCHEAADHGAAHALSPATAHGGQTLSLQGPSNATHRSLDAHVTTQAGADSRWR